MTDPNAEIRIRLVADDQSAAVIAKLVAGLGQASGHAEGAKEHSEGMAKELMKGELYAELAKKGFEMVHETLEHAYESAKEFVGEALEAANAAEKQEKAMAGLMMFMDGGKHSMKELRTYAAGVREELVGAGLAAGVSADAMTGAYDALIERGTMGTEQAKELAQDMAVVGKIAPQGMEGLAEGMSMLEMGMIRAKNPIVQVIAATHMLKGNAKEVAKQLQAMNPEKAMALAEKAIAKQADLLRGQNAGKPPQLGLDALRTSFSGIREEFFATLGGPMLDHLLPPLNRLKDFLLNHYDAIMHYAEMTGERFGEFIDMVSAAAEGIYKGVVDDAKFIKDSFDEIFGDWFRAWDYSAGHTDNIKSSFASFTDDMVRAFKLAMEIAKAMAELAMKAADVANGQAMGTSEAKIQNRSAEQAAINAASAKDMPGIEEAIEKYRQLALEAGQSADRVDRHSAAIRHMAEENMAAGAEAEESLRAQNYEEFNEYLKSAIENHSKGAQEFALNLVAKSDQAQHALIEGAIHIEGGFDEFMKVISERSPELAKKLKEMADPIKAQGGIKPSGPNNHFYGDMHIKQDFRDQDPDRVALVFRRDLVKNATARLDARTARSFGL